MDEMDIDLGPFNSSGGGLIYSSGDAVQGEIVLERDGVRIATRQNPYSLVTWNDFVGTSRYTVTMNARRQVSWSGYLPRVSSTWTFTGTNSGHGVIHLPIISARVSGAFDGWGRAPAGEVFPLELALEGTQGDAKSVELDVSYNDGQSWVPVPVSGTGDRWVATVRHPSSVLRPWVSLHVTVIDAQGNSVDWTAYRSCRIADLG
ncbi:hypothetical protein [Flindersiella endophytica]